MKGRMIPTEWLPNYNYSDYEKWKGDWELIEGIPYAMSPAPTRRHQYVGGQFVTLANVALQHKKSSCACEVLYESDWIIDEQTVVRPDVMIICNAPPSDFVRVPPNLVLEIFSPATRLKDRNIKFDLYAANGVKYYLMADAERNMLEIFLLKDNRYVEANETIFHLTPTCVIDVDLQKIW